MVILLKKSISLSDLWVSSSEKLSKFHASSWQRGESALPLLLLRLLLLAATLGILVWSLVRGLSGYWFLYLTNWGLLLLTFMTLSAFVVSCYAYRATDRPEYGEVPWYISTYWVFHNINIPLAFMITALYWSLLYGPETEIESFAVFMLEFSTHGLNSCISFLELLMARTPVRMLHFYQPLAVGLWYAAFSAIYYAAGGTDAKGNPFIYGVLDWRNGRQAGTIVGISVVALIVLYIAMYGFALCRNKISVKLIRTKGHDLPTTPHYNTRIV